MKLKQNGCHFTDNTFKCIFLNENFWILNEVSLKYDLLGLIDNMATFVQIMAWHQAGTKPLSEPVLVCFTDSCMHHLASLS